MTARPDIILVMTDEQRADSLGYAGNRFVATGHIDALAGRSLRFRNGVTPFPQHLPHDAPDRDFPRYRGSGLPHAPCYAAVDGIDACVGG